MQGQEWSSRAKQKYSGDENAEVNFQENLRLGMEMPGERVLTIGVDDNGNLTQVIWSRDKETTGSSNEKVDQTKGSMIKRGRGGPKKS